MSEKKKEPARRRRNPKATKRALTLVTTTKGKEGLDPALEIPDEETRRAMLEMQDKLTEFLKPHPGRPKLPIDETQVEKLAAFFLSNAEIASFFDVSADTIERRYAAAVKRGREFAKASLKRQQFMQALAGNITMLIWMGKQHLGQSDKVDLRNPFNNPDVKEEPQVFRIGGQEIRIA